jgi:peptide-methionine (S)-S-oxide reductase
MNLQEVKLNRIFRFLLFSFLISFSSCGKDNESKVNYENKLYRDNMNADFSKLDTATFGAGCFWCVEAVFERLKGVEMVVSGYSGGSVANPTYSQVCEGNTGHAEVCQIYFDPTKVSFKELLEVFWKTHDPTTLDRQGNDEGTQYRSVIFFHNEEQKKIAEFYKKELDNSGAYPNPIVTEISKFSSFFVAEDYHQNYFNENGNQPYCSFVIKPKVDKFQKAFKEKLK